MLFLLKRLSLDKTEFAAFLIISISSIIISAFLLPDLIQFKYNFGKPLICMFIAPITSVGYLLYFSYHKGVSKKICLQTVLLYLIQIIPFYKIFSAVYIPTINDDFERYVLYAKNMYVNKTLWGGDNLFFKGCGLHYVTQPGYRYLIFSELSLFGDLYRGVTFIYMALYIISMYLFLKVIDVKISDKKLKTCLFILMLLITPYAIKNLLMGLSEWFTIVISISFCYFYFVLNKISFSVVLLALVPFFRQNLLIVVICLFCIVVYKRKLLLLYTLLFIITLLLPVYHNLYYANEFNFFVDLFEPPKLIFENNRFSLSGVNFNLIKSNIIHYLGFDFETGELRFSFIGFIFLPFALYVYWLMLTSFKNFKIRFLYLLITSSFVLPIIVLGNAYYPRFEFVNTFFSLIVFVCLFSKIQQMRITKRDS